MPPRELDATTIERIAQSINHFERVLAEAEAAGVEPPAHPVKVAEAAKAETDPAQFSLASDDLQWAAQRIQEFVRIELIGAGEAERGRDLAATVRRRALKHLAATAVSYIGARRRVFSRDRHAARRRRPQASPHKTS
jgi:hypothetical protein